MAGPATKLPQTIWLGIEVVLGLLALAYLVQTQDHYATGRGRLPALGQIADFTLTKP